MSEGHDGLVRELVPLAAREAYSVWSSHGRRHPLCCLDDLEAAALVGLWKGVRDYDPARATAPLEVYARTRARQECQDWLRCRVGRPGNPRRLAEARMVSLEAAPNLEGHATRLRLEAQDRRDKTLAEEALRLVPRGQLREVVRHFYLGGKSQKDIAAEMQVSESRVSQMMSEALEFARWEAAA